jgi:formate-dependent nitrite reductase membrane component NrfD
MAQVYDYSSTWLWVIFIGMAIVIPGLVILFDDPKVHNK